MQGALENRMQREIRIRRTRSCEPSCSGGAETSSLTLHKGVSDIFYW